MAGSIHTSETTATTTATATSGYRTSPSASGSVAATAATAPGFHSGNFGIVAPNGSAEGSLRATMP